MNALTISWWRAGLPTSRGRPGGRPSKNRFAALAAGICLASVPLFANTPSATVRTDADGKLTYTADAAGNRVIDFSSAGYAGGGEPPPAVPARIIVTPDGRHDRERIQSDVFSERFLIKRPLLQALEPDPAGAPVLLIDELDRTDEAFEAFLLEVLADFQVTIPEMGTVKAEHPPIVIITSNRTREIHDALKRRCLYHWVGYPNAERELAIVRARLPGIAEKLSQEIVHFVQKLRREDLFKSPGVAETLDWASALSELDVVALDPATVSDTLGVLLKYQDDIARLDGSKVKDILDDVRAELRAAE